ncbi:MAG: hypothetical protein SWY16_03615 [Cyanobacteriota bacterium]|nr:hypothetical protein [Cyanobacteriota bacterium]
MKRILSAVGDRGWEMLENPVRVAFATIAADIPQIADRSIWQATGNEMRSDGDASSFGAISTSSSRNSTLDRLLNLPELQKNAVAIAFYKTHKWM